MIEPGAKLAHYEIVSALGKGGMGEVWRARDTKLGREVAIKTLPEEFAEDTDRLARFEREAKLLASLNHPNIAAIHGLEESDQEHFLVLELVEGDTLADRLERGPIPVEEALKLALQIAEALEAAHDNGVIHRDLKPANVKVTPDGRVKVLDFGLAKALTGDESDVSLSNSPTLSMAATQQGVILGTAGYMSPEQARGEAADNRADIWAFGCVVFEMLTGQGTFNGKTVSDVLAGVLRAEPEWNTLPANLHPRLRLLLERCLEKKARNRYAGIGDARVDIEKALADPGGALPGPAADVVRLAPSKTPWVAAAALAVLGVVAGYLLRPVPRSDPAATRFDHELIEGTFRNTTRDVLTVSPDGRLVAYDTPGGIYVRSMDEMEARPIPGTEAPLTTPFFSPDSEWIAYWEIASQQLKKIRVSGGSPVTLATAIDPQGASWGGDDLIVWGGTGGIMGVSGQGGEPEVLIPSLDTGFLANPQILPDGRILFAAFSNTSAVGQITIATPGADDRTPLFQGERAFYVPTGHLVVTDPGSPGVILARSFDLGTLEVGGPVPMQEGVLVSQARTHYSVSPAGTLVYIPGSSVLGNESLELALLDRDGSAEIIDVPPNYYLSPSLSPDGMRLAVQTLGEEGSSIHVYDLSGETVMRRLTQQGQGDNSFPVWTADGGSVTFSSNRAGTSGIYSQLANGSAPAELLLMAEDGASIWPNAWSPDGETLVYTRQEPGTFSVWTWKRDGEPERLPETEEAISALMGAFSPDGDWLAYQSDETGNYEVFVQPFPPTGAKYQVTESAPDISLNPLWAADGNELIIERALPVGQQVELRLVSVDVVTDSGADFGDETLLPTQGFFGDIPYRDYAIAPDGERFLVAMLPDESAADAIGNLSRVNIVLHWFEELRERVPVD